MTQLSKSSLTGQESGTQTPGNQEMQGDRDMHNTDWEQGWGGESGQVLPWVALAMLVVLATSALVIDLGRAMVLQRELQASADAAALAAAQTMPKSTYSSVAQDYSALTGEKNAYGDLTITSATVTPLCLSTVTGWGNGCGSVATNPNAVSVTQTATVSTFFGGVIGKKNLTISATSTAARGSKPLPYNVAIILDTTPSMDTWDNNCGATQLQCAVKGVQQLLQGLAPSLDSVSLFTFPNITTTTTSNDYDCSSSNPTTGPYTFPAPGATTLQTMPWTYTTGSGWTQHTTTVQMTYQVLDFKTDYRSSDTATTLNTSSNLTRAVGGKSGCTGMQTSQENTYYAAAIYAAQAALTARKTANPGTQNALILLSDGNATAKENNPGGDFQAGSNDMVTGTQSTRVANSSGNYPSWNGECGQGVDAAQAATTAGTTVFTIAYGSSTHSDSSNCASDRSAGTHRGITPCQAMQQMSTGWGSGDTTHFYSDYYAPGGDASCQASGAAQQTTSLNNIFQSILVNLTGARLIPNDTQ